MADAQTNVEDKSPASFKVGDIDPTTSKVAGDALCGWPVPGRNATGDVVTFSCTWPAFHPTHWLHVAGGGGLILGVA